MLCLEENGTSRLQGSVANNSYLNNQDAGLSGFQKQCSDEKLFLSSFNPVAVSIGQAPPARPVHVSRDPLCHPSSMGYDN